MLQSDSDALIEAQSVSRPTRKRRTPTRRDAAQDPSNIPQIRPLPRWVTFGASAQGNAPDRVAGDAASAHFCAGAALARLDQILRAGADVSSAGKSGAEPVFAGALRQRLALRAATACAAMLRLREDERDLRDAEHLAGVDAAPPPAGRLHRLWRLFATCPRRLDARFMRSAADCLELPQDLDLEALASALQSVVTSAENPLVSAARASAMALHVLDQSSPIDAEIFALWLTDVVLAQRLDWGAPLPLLATTITHPSMRAANGRRPRSSDPDWASSVARAASRAAQEAYALAGELSRRSETLLRVAPKLRAKKSGRVIAMLLADDCVSAVRAAKAVGLSDRASRRLFDRLVALGAVRELSGRPNFRLYGL